MTLHLPSPLRPCFIGRGKKQFWKGRCCFLLAPELCCATLHCAPALQNELSSRLVGKKGEFSNYMPNNEGNSVKKELGSLLCFISLSEFVFPIKENVGNKRTGIISIS